MILEVFSGVGKFWAVTNPLDGQLLGYHNHRAYVFHFLGNRRREIISDVCDKRAMNVYESGT